MAWGGARLQRRLAVDGLLGAEDAKDPGVLLLAVRRDLERGNRLRSARKALSDDVIFLFLKCGAFFFFLKEIRGNRE